MNWITITIFGAFFQNLRSSLQKKLNTNLSLVASCSVRFIFALPFALLIFYLYFSNFEILLDVFSQKNFFYLVFLASIFQIFFTIILLYLFKFSNFVVGTSLSKSEVILVAVFEYLILKDILNTFEVFGIIIATLGVIIMTIKDTKFFFENLFSKTTLIGLFSGLLLALSVVYFRAATISLENFTSNFEKALSTIFCGLVIQTFLLILYLLIFERSEIKKLYNYKLECSLAGLAGFLATMSWFYAFTLIQASFVRALGQIELLFSYISSKYYFKEKIKKIEIIGISTFVFGISIILFNKLL